MHRTASVNEYSTRYSEPIDSMAKTAPDAWRLQAKDNKQGSDGSVIDWPDGFRMIHDSSYDADDDRIIEGDGVDSFLLHPGGWSRVEDGFTPGDFLSRHEGDLHRGALAVYRERLAFGVAREQARKDLPLSQYTEAYWKCDLRNVLGFLLLRMDSHAQAEIRAFADVIGHQIIAPLFPATWEAFNDYQLGAVTLSRLEAEAIRGVLGGALGTDDALSVFASKREREECRAKLARLGILDEEAR